jgi:hypothetical protein
MVGVPGVLHFVCKLAFQVPLVFDSTAARDPLRLRRAWKQMQCPSRVRPRFGALAPARVDVSESLIDSIAAGIQLRSSNPSCSSASGADSIHCGNLSRAAQHSNSEHQYNGYRERSCP